MQNGYDRRKYKRLPIELHLEIDHIFKQDYVVIDNIDAEVSVFDISKTGIGFISEAEIPTNYYFNAKVKLGDADFFYAVIQILRCKKMDSSSYIYGAEFVGLAPFLANKVDKYEKMSQHESDSFLE